MGIRDAVVIGCGIVGATVACALRKRGLDVLVLDDARAEAGTPASGGHLKPSWFRSMPRREYEPAMELLDEIWGLRAEAFRVWPTQINTTVYRVDTDQVIRTERTISSVTELRSLDNYPLVVHSGGEERTRLLVVAAGVWCRELVRGLPPITPKRGVSFRAATVLRQPFIKPWAPFKQVVAHQQTEGEVWVGDGSAILPSNWGPERTQDCWQRCAAACGLSPGVQALRTTYGMRPYCEPASKGEPCLLKRVSRRVWVATGAGKSGTIAAGWAALRICDDL